MSVQVHFIHINGVLHTLYAVDGHKDATPACMAMGQGPGPAAVRHIWKLTTLLGYDWDLLFTSCTYQIHFIQIKVVWHT